MTAAYPSNRRVKMTAKLSATRVDKLAERLRGECIPVLEVEQWSSEADGEVRVSDSVTVQVGNSFYCIDTEVSEGEFKHSPLMHTLDDVVFALAELLYAN
jgi:hypothetical protein